MRFSILSTLCLFGLAASADYNRIERQTFLVDPILAETGRVKVAFFDADSTLRISRSGLPWASYDTDFIVLPGVAEKIRELNRQGYVVAIVSNQGRIPVSLTFKEADEAFFNLAVRLKTMGAIVHYFDFAEKVDEYRKPNPGMFSRLEANLRTRFGSTTSIDKANSFMVGDAAYKKSELRPDGRQGADFSNADRGFAERSGIGFVEASTFFGWTRFGYQRIDTRYQAALLERKCAKELLGVR